MTALDTLAAWRHFAVRRLALLALALIASHPLVAFFVAPSPLVLQCLVGALLLATLVRPVYGWLTLIAIAPFGDLIGRLAGSPYHGQPWSVTEPLVLAFLVGWFVREVFRPSDPLASASSSTRLALDLAALLALAVAASMAVQLIVLQVSTAFPLDFARFLWRFMWRDYHSLSSELPIIHGAALMLEGIGLFVATVVMVANVTGLARRGAVVFAGAAALVAIVNVGEAAQQLHLKRIIITTLRDLFVLRVSFAFPDVNAAGSYFVMALFGAAGLAVAAVRSRSLWLVGGFLCLVGLALAGSRTALAAAPLVTAFLALALRRRSARGAARLLLPALLGLAVLGAAFALWSPRSAPADMGTGVRYRMALYSTAWNMAQVDPVFGVGPGRFFDASSEHLRQEESVPFPRENAHNNLLQVLAELGGVGLALLLGLLAVVLSVFYEHLGLSRSDAWVDGLATGVLAFLLTWMTGHPLLVREVAMSFWLVLGLTVAGGQGVRREAASEARPRSPGRWFLVIAGLVMVSLVPLRAERWLAKADLTRQGRGFSQWHEGPDGVRFRWMFRRAVLYVPAAARVVAVGLRSPGAAAAVRFVVEDRVVGQLVVEGSAWEDCLIEVPRGYRWKSVPVEITVRAYQRQAPPAAEADRQDRLQVALPGVLK